MLFNPGAFTEQFDNADFMPTTQVVAVDTGTLQVTSLTAQLPGSGYGYHSDGQYIVWIGEADVQVVDLDTKERFGILQGLANQGMSIDFFEQGWIVGTTYRGSDNIIVARNLQTGTEHNLLVNLAGRGVALNGGRLSIQYFPDLFPLDDGPVLLDDLDFDLLYASNVDVFDLGTGQRTTVLTGLPAFSPAQLGGDYVWIVDDRWDWSVKVRVLHLATGDTRTVLELPATGSEWHDIELAGEIGAILRTSSYSEESGASTDTWRLLTPDGGVQTIVETSIDPMSWEIPINPQPSIVGSVVVYQDPGNGDWVVFDPAAGTRRSLQPFE